MGIFKRHIHNITDIRYEKEIHKNLLKQYEAKKTMREEKNISKHSKAGPKLWKTQAKYNMKKKKRKKHFISKYQQKQLPNEKKTGAVWEQRDKKYQSALLWNRKEKNRKNTYIIRCVKRSWCTVNQLLLLSAFAIIKYVENLLIYVAC